MTGLQRHWVKIRKSAGLEDMRLHDCRTLFRAGPPFIQLRPAPAPLPRPDEFCIIIESVMPVSVISSPPPSSNVPRRPAAAIQRSRSARSAAPTLPVTENWTPDTAHDAVRDVVRAREAAVKNRTRKRQEIRSFLLHHQNKATGRPRQFPILATPRENMVRVHVILAHQDRHLNPGLVTLRHDQVLVATVS